MIPHLNFFSFLRKKCCYSFTDNEEENRWYFGMFSKRAVTKHTKGRLYVFHCAWQHQFKLGMIFTCQVLSALESAPSSWLQLLCTPIGGKHLLFFLVLCLNSLITYLYNFLWGPHHCIKTILFPFILTVSDSVWRISGACQSRSRRADPKV